MKSKHYSSLKQGTIGLSQNCTTNTFLKFTSCVTRITYSPKHEAPSFSDVMKTNV